jgi:hypothetical protein
MASEGIIKTFYTDTKKLVIQQKDFISIENKIKKLEIISKEKQKILGDFLYYPKYNNQRLELTNDEFNIINNLYKEIYLDKPNIKIFNFNDMYEIIDINKDNFCINLNIEEYRKTTPQIILNKEKYLNSLLLSLNNDATSILYTSIRNILNNDSIKFISLESFFEKLFIIFNKFIIKIENIIKENDNSYFYVFTDKLDNNKIKSNYWITLLFIKFIRDNNYNFCNDKIFFIDEPIVDNRTQELKIREGYENYIIYLDDCSYSGT